MEVAVSITGSDGGAILCPQEGACPLTQCNVNNRNVKRINLRDGFSLNELKRENDKEITDTIKKLDAQHKLIEELILNYEQAVRKRLTLLEEWTHTAEALKWGEADRQEMQRTTDMSSLVNLENDNAQLQCHLRTLAEDADDLNELLTLETPGVIHTNIAEMEENIPKYQSILEEHGGHTQEIALATCMKEEEDASSMSLSNMKPRCQHVKTARSGVGELKGRLHRRTILKDSEQHCDVLKLQHDPSFDVGLRPEHKVRDKLQP